MDLKKKETCETCKFSQKDSTLSFTIPKKDELICCFNPPVVYVTQYESVMQVDSLSPIVNKTDWCGKYEENSN